MAKKKTDEKPYKLGTRVKPWGEGNKTKTITFIVTEDCNFRCTYCYLVGKNSANKMSFDIAQKSVDYILDHPEHFSESQVIWEFIGGEPFLEIELIDRISDYIKIESYKKRSDWFENHMFNFSSNGSLYSEAPVQAYIEKNKEHLSIGISIDGNKAKHDQSRIYADGNGTYDDVVKNLPLWQKQFPTQGTKATFGREDLKYLKDSVLHLWELGIKQVAANVLFEDVWEIGDDKLLEEQLKQLADEVIEQKLWKEYNCTFFSETIGQPLRKDQLTTNWCGAGKMLAVGTDGTFYPCVRFAPYSSSSGKARPVGNIYDGIDSDRLRPFLSLTYFAQSSKECIECEVASGCAWCQGFNLDAAATDTVFRRATFICKMHKARCRANEYYWKKLKAVEKIERQALSPEGGKR